MSSPDGKNSTESAQPEHGPLEAELAKARAEAEAAELKAKVLALEAEIQRRGSAATEKPDAGRPSKVADLPLKKVPPPTPRGRVNEVAEKPAAKPKAAPLRSMAALLGASQSWVLSMAVHLAAMIVLGLIYLDVPDVDDLLPLVASVDDEMDELEELPEEELEFDEIEGLAFDIEDPGMADFGQPELPDEMSEMSLEHVSSTIDQIGALFGDSGKGWATAGTGSGGAEFYGLKTRGNKFVFVVDNSLSMSKGRFESACYELYYSVTKMSPDQQFYVFFFSDTAYPLYYPAPAQGMVPADRTNKDLLARWLPTVQLVLRTDARKAVEMALAMKPSGIYILTDGAFTDNTSQMLLQMPKGRTTIHTVGMEIQGKQEETLKKIAEHHGGSYRHVRVDPRMRMQAQKSPRKRNNRAGPVWGIALGQPKAKRIRPQQPNRPNQPGKKPGKGPNKKPAKKN